MPNALITPSWVTKEVARILVNNLKFAASVNRSYDDQFVHDGAKVGYTVNARLPQRFTTTKGAALVVQDIVDQVVPITLTDQAQVGISFGTASLTMEVDDYRSRYIVPAASQLANTVDFDGLNRCAKQVPSQVGTIGTPPAGTQAAQNGLYLSAGVVLSNNAAPVDNRVLVVSPQQMADLVQPNLSLFNPSAAISDGFRKGQFGQDVLGFEYMYQDQNVARLTVSTLTAGTVTTASQTGSVINVTGVTGSAAAGDLVTFLGVNSVNPQNYSDSGQLQKFVLTAPVAPGATTINIKPAIVTTGNLKTVTASPAAGATITGVGTTGAVGPVGLGFHPDAFALVMADLVQPEGVWASERVRSKELGISIRFVKAYDIFTDNSPARLDILYGWATIRPELAVRIAS